MYILYGIFSGKNGYMYEKIDLLKQFCTYCMVFLLILQITKFLVYIRRDFYSTIIRTVRYFLSFFGTGNIVKYKKWCCMYIRFVQYCVLYIFQEKKRYFVYKKIGKKFMVFTVFYCFVLQVLISRAGRASPK